MYCVMCGVKLEDTEEKCPLCATPVMYPQPKPAAQPLYPKDRYTQIKAKPGVINGFVLILFLIPLLLSFFIDWQTDQRLSWFGYAAGGMLLGYVVIALPLWFRKPNPVIFVPCDFAAIILYLLYIDLSTGGGWFLPFAFPVTGALGLIVTAVVTLTRYLRRGKLYVFGGALMALGTFMPLLELLLGITFGLHTVFWSVYPFTALLLLGASLIYLAINKTARERIERKLFF